MSRRRAGRSRRTQIDGQFAARLIEMLESPTFQALSLSARRVLDRLEIELAHHGGMDNGRLPVTYDDFQGYGIDRHAIAPAIRELEALGFIEVTERGRAGNAEFRTPNRFRLTYKHTKAADPTHEWKRFATPEKAQQTARQARQPVTRRPRVSLAKKQKPVSRNTGPSVGSAHLSPVPKSPTTCKAEKPTLLSISRGGEPGRRSGSRERKLIRPRISSNE